MSAGVTYGSQDQFNWNDALCFDEEGEEHFFFTKNYSNHFRILEISLLSSSVVVPCSLTFFSFFLWSPDCCSGVSDLPLPNAAWHPGLVINPSFLSLFSVTPHLGTSLRNISSLAHARVHTKNIWKHTRPNCHLPPRLSGSSHSASLCLSNLSDACWCRGSGNGKGPGWGCTSAESSSGITTPLMLIPVKWKDGNVKTRGDLTRSPMTNWTALAGVCDSKCGGDFGRAPGLNQSPLLSSPRMPFCPSRM